MDGAFFFHTSLVSQKSMERQTKQGAQTGAAFYAAAVAIYDNSVPSGFVGACLMAFVLGVAFGVFLIRPGEPDATQSEEEACALRCHEHGYGAEPAVYDGRHIWCQCNTRLEVFELGEPDPLDGEFLPGTLSEP